jgi:hypothetical protein
VWLKLEYAFKVAEWKRVMQGTESNSTALNGLRFSGWCFFILDCLWK